jgi:hypothetical protein
MNISGGCIFSIYVVSSRIALSIVDRLPYFLLGPAASLQNEAPFRGRLVRTKHLGF